MRRRAPAAAPPRAAPGRAAPTAAGLVAAAVAVTLAAGLAGGCERRAPLTSCDDDLRGVYADAAGGRWMILDLADQLEIYPLFPDAGPALAAAAGLEVAPPGLEVAPRMLTLRRAPGKIAGDVRRRYMRGAQACVARAPARITACAGDELELVLSDPEPPLLWPDAPDQGCRYPRPGSSRVERWRRR